LLIEQDVVVSFSRTSNAIPELGSRLSAPRRIVEAGGTLLK
jgi:hypothetical protein